MTVLFTIQTRKPDCDPVYLATVKGIEARLVGYWNKGENSKPWTVDRDAIREALPHYWRKPFDRSTSFWFVEDGKYAYCNCFNTQGKKLFSVWATPYEYQESK